LAYDRYEVSSVKANLAADTDYGLLQATAYTNWIEAEAFAGDSPTTALSPDNRVTVLQLQGISKLASEHTLRLSAEYRDNTMATVPEDGGDVSYEVAAAGAMWEWRIQPALALTSAVRVDHWQLRREGALPAGYGLSNDDWRRSESEWSYNTGLVWQPGAADTLRFVVARGVQLPSLLALGGLVMRLSPPLAPPFYASGSPDLDPTTVDNFEIAWDHAFSDLDARLHTSLYRGHSQHLLANAGDARPMEGLVSLPINVGDSKTVGIEVAFDTRFGHGWRAGTSYTGQLVNDHFKASADPAVTLVAFEETTPKHVLRTQLGWADERWETDLYLRYQSRFDGFTRLPGPSMPGELTPIGDYFSLDARIARTFGERLVVAVSGQNLHRSEQQETSAPAVERMVFATLEVKLGKRP
jgi:iron complex outermembrane receptor protein